jgi:HEAT repeat protein
MLDDDIGTRLAVLKAVGENPQAALRYGKHNGRDLIDVLIDQVTVLSNSSLRQVMFSVLALLPGERVKQTLIKELHLGNDQACLESAGQRLAGEEPEERLRIFEPFLMQDENPAKARQAACALAGLEGLSPSQRLRVALVGPEGDYEPPRLDAEGWQLWAGALTGEHAEYARSLVRRQGKGAFNELKRRWEELDQDNRGWLLDWGSSELPLETVELLARALEQGPEETALKALDCVTRYEQAGGLFADAAAKWAGHGDPRLRRAAIAAGARVDLAALAQNEPDEAVRLAAIKRLGSENGASHAELLAELLGDGSWRVRAAASQALGNLGGRGAELARQVLKSGNQPARIAAAQALLAMDQENWSTGQLQDAGATLT